MEKMEKRVYGAVGIKSVLSNWNADFDGNPRTTAEGKIFGSDKAFKYPIKRMWESEGKNVLYIKSYSQGNKKNDEISINTLEERFNKIFGIELERENKSLKQLNRSEITKYLFKATDVMNFGATFADKNKNISITGAVQVGQGYNKYANTNIELMDILSPFPSNVELENSSIGSKIVVDEAHYMYPFSVNPSNYDIYKNSIGDECAYTKEAYEDFKRGCLVAATAFNTNSKSGCENEFAIFVECREGSKLYLANLDQYIKFEKNENDKDIIDITELSEILETYKNEIENVEVYYNKYTLNIKGMKDYYVEKYLF